jgi:secondary thiamine-phosphate synthase enzyme
MEAVVPMRGFGHAHIRIATDHPTQFIDLTDRLEALVVQSGIRFGFVNVQSLHTTAAIIVNENEPLLLSDFAAALERSAPACAVYRHDDVALRTVNLTADERVNGHAHCRALILGMSACINVIYGRLHLGAWQRVFLVELDGPRDREVSVLILGEGER